MKVSDYVMDFIHGLGVDKVFCVTGGGAMHLNNSLGSSKDVQGVFMLHEQGASIAAESYARIREGYGICLVTSGPGATNAITGLCGAYMDSIPVIFISGQAKRADLVGDQGIRQFGIQEVDIISLVKSYTKYAVRIMEPDRIRYELEKAAHLAVSGRPGAVWIDVPLDVQASDVSPEALEGYIPDDAPSSSVTDDEIKEIVTRLSDSKKPTMILGNGVRLSHAADKARKLAEVLGIPVFVSWNGVDLMDSDDPLFFGRPNIVGHRSANLILQSADFVLSIGTRLSLLNTGYNFEGYLEHAYHVMVDIDENEMNKKSLHPRMKIRSDAGEFIDRLLHALEGYDADKSSWLKHCMDIREKYPVMIPEQEPRPGFVSLYSLFDVLSDEMKADDIYQFTSSGTSVDIGMKVLRLKKGQRAFLNKSMAAMGYDVPACVGSSVGSGGKRIICVTGDGSIAMNIQELEVIKRLHLPVKIFVADNSGYSMIWHSQTGNFKGHLTGCTEDSGLTLPDMKAVAEAFGIKAMVLDDVSRLRDTVREVLQYDGPVLCVVKCDITQKVLPKQSSYMDENGQMRSRPLQDMFPLLDEEELKSCMDWKS